MAYWGQYKVKIDDKGRVSLPASFRPDFVEAEGGFLVWLADHLALMTEHAFAKYFRQFEEREDLTSNDLKVLASWATPFKLDHQGRMVIPQNLRERASLNGEVMLVGVKSHIGIHDADDWAEQERQRAADPNSALARAVKETWIQ